jgi:hypothetical protein
MALGGYGQDGGNASGAAIGKRPIATSLAGLVFLALVALFALRHLFGSIHIEAGSK